MGSLRSRNRPKRRQTSFRPLGSAELSSENRDSSEQGSLDFAFRDAHELPSLHGSTSDNSRIEEIFDIEDGSDASVFAPMESPRYIVTSRALRYPTPPRKRLLEKLAQERIESIGSVQLSTKNLSTSSLGFSQCTTVSSRENFLEGFKSLRDGSATFSAELENYMKSLACVLKNAGSQLHFRIFAECYALLLNKFGPGGPKAHLAPSSPSWMLRLTIPLLLVDTRHDEARICCFWEVNCWVRQIVEFYGEAADEMIFAEGLWEILAQKMANSDAAISGIAYCSLTTIVSSLALDEDLVCRVRRLRSEVVPEDAEAKSNFVYHHLQLMELTSKRLLQLPPGRAQHSLLSAIVNQYQEYFIRERDTQKQGMIEGFACKLDRSIYAIYGDVPARFLKDRGFRLRANRQTGPSARRSLRSKLKSVLQRKRHRLIGGH